MLERKIIELTLAPVEEFKRYKYVPGRVRKSNRRPKWAFAMITKSIKYASFTKLLENVVETEFVSKVRVNHPKGESRRRGRFYEVIRKKLDKREIQEVSNKANKVGYLDVYMWNQERENEGIENRIRFYKVDGGKVMSTYLAIPGNEKDLYTWKGPKRDYGRIYAAVPTPIKK